MLGAALLARNAVERGLTVKPWVKTSMAPGSKVVTNYYEKAGLWPYLEKLGYHLVGYGCTTCIGNSGPLSDEISAAVNEADLSVVSVLSGNRNFEGRINPDVKMNYLASPAAGDRLRAGRHHGLRLRDPAPRPGHRRQRRVPARHLALGPGRAEHHRLLDQRGDVHQGLRRRVRRRRAVDLAAHAGGQHLRVGPGLDLRAQAPVLRRHAARAVAGRGHQRRPGAGAARRLGDHRPHLPRRLDQGRHAGRAVPERARRARRRTSTPTAPGAATTR